AGSVAEVGCPGVLLFSVQDTPPVVACGAAWRDAAPQAGTVLKPQAGPTDTERTGSIKGPAARSRGFRWAPGGPEPAPSRTDGWSRLTGRQGLPGLAPRWQPASGPARR